MKPRFIRALSLLVLPAFLFVLSVPAASAHVLAVKRKPHVQAKSQKAIVKDPKAQALIEKTLRQYPPRILILQWGVSTTSATSDIEKTDWSGSVSVSEGALKVRRLIRFEKNDRVYVKSGQKVEWTSTIRNMRDGLVIAVGASDDATLTINTPYTGELTFKVGDLAKKPYSNKELKIEGRDVNYSVDAVLTVAPKVKNKGKRAQ